MTVTDTGSNTTRYEYDALDRRTKVTNALAQATMYTYDTVGNLRTTTDRSGGTRTYEYDALNRLQTITDPTGRVYPATYDPNGAISWRCTFSGRIAHDLKPVNDIGVPVWGSKIALTKVGIPFN